MQLVRRVALGGVQLDEVDERIVIRAVEPAEGKGTISTVSSAAGNGQRITGSRRDTTEIKVTFAILEHGITEEGMQARAEVLEAANAWAAAASRENGGAWLTVGYKPNRRLRVVLEQAPGEGGMRDYTKEFSVTFKAYEIPYWEEESANSTVIGGSVSSKTGSIEIGGSAPAQLNVQLDNKSGALINTATVSVGGKSIAFTDLALAARESLFIDHTDRGLIRMRIRNTSGSYRSVMAKRTATSADDLVVTPGVKSISYSAQRACEMTVTWRARFL